MASIAIIDDNKDQRESLKIQLKVLLKKKDISLDVIDIFPFEKYETYYPWITEQDVCTLIFDERLHDNTEGNKGPVAYKGNDLVVKIRERYKNIPIFTVTAHTQDEDLLAKFNEFEYIIPRDDFDEKYVDIIIRASQRYLDENKNELALFDELTRKVASGNGTSEDLQTIKALQVKLQIPLMNDLKDREEWLREYERHIQSLEYIDNMLKAKLKK